MKGHEGQNAAQSQDRDRLIVENYKNSFRAMKDRLRKFSKANMPDESKDKENIHQMMAKKKSSCLISAEVQGNSPIFQKSNTNCTSWLASHHKEPICDSQYANQKYLTNSSNSGELNILVEDKSKKASKVIFSNMNMQALSNISNGPGLTKNSDQIQANVDLQAQNTLLSFRAPFPIREEGGCQQVHLVDMSTDLVPENAEADLFRFRSLDRSPTEFASITVSQIRSPSRDLETAGLPKAKKRIVIDLLSSPRSVEGLQESKAKQDERKELVKKQTEIAKCSELTLEERLEAIKMKALEETYMDESLGYLPSQPESGLPSKPKLMKELEQKIPQQEIKESQKSAIEKKKFIGATKDRFGFSSRSKSFFKPPSESVDRRAGDRKNSEHSLIAKSELLTRRSKHCKRGPATCQNSIDSSRNQDTPSFHQLSLSKRKQKVPTFTNFFTSSPSKLHRNQSLCCPTSRKESLDLTSTSRSRMNHKESRLKSQTPKKPPTRATSPLFQETDQRPKVRLVDLMTRLAKGERVKVEKDDMLRLTRKNYSQLPEVLQQAKAKQAKEEIREKVQRVKEYDLVDLV